MTSQAVINAIRLFSNQQIIPFQALDIDQMTSLIEVQRKKPQTSESELAQLLQEAAVQCLNSLNLEKADEFYKQIGQKSLSNDLLCGYFLAEARANLYLGVQKNDFVPFQHSLNQIKMEKLSFEMESQTKLYKAIADILNKQNLNASFSTFISSISTFSADEILDFSGFSSIALLLATSILSRKGLKDLVDSQIDALQASEPQIVALIKCIINFNYTQFYTILEQIDNFISQNFFIVNIKTFLLEKITANIYQQYLQAFLVTGVQEMANEFQKEFKFLQGQLEYFIYKDMIQARIDAVNWQISKVEENECDKWWNKFMLESSTLIGKIEQIQKGK